MDDSEWTERTPNIEEGGLSLVVTAVIKGESRVGNLEKSNLDRLGGKTSINSPIKGYE